MTQRFEPFLQDSKTWAFSNSADPKNWTVSDKNLIQRSENFFSTWPNPSFQHYS